jgi:hypothetical protein
MNDIVTIDNLNVIPFNRSPVKYGSIALPRNAGPISYERMIKDDQGLRFVALTDYLGRPAIAIARVNYYGDVMCNDGKAGGTICFEHDKLTLQQEHIFGITTYKAVVEIDDHGMKIDVTIPAHFHNQKFFGKYIFWKS